LKDGEVLRRAIEDAMGGLVNDTFAYAERFDSATNRYVGLKTTGGGTVIVDSQTVVVKRDAAAAQIARARGGPSTPTTTDDTTGPGDSAGTPSPDSPGPKQSKIGRRYTASVMLDPDRPSRDMGRVAEEVLAHLSTLPHAKLKITVEIEAEIPEGVPEGIQRIVLENGNTLKFRSQGFEED
jgi:hypothetical protein